MRTVATTIIDRWIDRNRPDGLAELARKSGVSRSTIHWARHGRAPKTATKRLNICEALGIPEDELFPPVATEGTEAS